MIIILLFLSIINAISISILTGTQYKLNSEHTLIKDNYSLTDFLIKLQIPKYAAVFCLIMSSFLFGRGGFVNIISLIPQFVCTMFAIILAEWANIRYIKYTNQYNDETKGEAGFDNYVIVCIFTSISMIVLCAIYVWAFFTKKQSQ